MGSSIESMTLREKLSEADRLIRELIEHLDSGFIPKARGLSRILQEHGTDVEAVSDVTIRQQAAELIDNNRFSEQLYEKIGKLLASIDNDVAEI